MMQSNQVLEVLRTTLVESDRVAYFNNIKSELIIRCVYCGDSLKNKNHAHFFIKNEAPFPFYCQRCNTKGILNRDTLRDINVGNDELISNISSISRQALRNTKVSLNDNELIPLRRKLVLPPIDLEKEKDRYCKEYLEKRLGIPFSKAMMEECRIVTSYRHLINLNKMENLRSYFDSSDGLSKKLSFLDKHGIGFTSIDNNYVSFRYMKEHQKGYRFSIEPMNHPIHIGKKIYALGNGINLLSPRLHLVMAEGIMDIIGVYYHLYNGQKKDNQLFLASTGKAFKQVIMLVKSMGFLSIDLDMYSDKDVDLSLYRYLFNDPVFNSVRIHYNMVEGEKDFGVSKDRISLKSFILKRG